MIFLVTAHLGGPTDVVRNEAYFVPLSSNRESTFVSIAFHLRAPDATKSLKTWILPGQTPDTLNPNPVSEVWIINTLLFAPLESFTTWNSNTISSLKCFSSLDIIIMSLFFSIHQLVLCHINIVMVQKWIVNKIVSGIFFNQIDGVEVSKDLKTRKNSFWRSI